MKFKLDENLGGIGRELLRPHDVMTVAEQKLSGADDQRLYELCRDEGRILVTLDQDFAHVSRFPPEITPGIVVLICRGRLTPASIRKRIAEFAAVLKGNPIDRRLWIVEPGRVRIHQREEG